MTSSSNAALPDFSLGAASPNTAASSSSVEITRLSPDCIRGRAHGRREARGADALSRAAARTSVLLDDALSPELMENTNVRFGSAGCAPEGR